LAARVLSGWPVDAAGCTRERAAGISGLGHRVVNVAKWSPAAYLALRYGCAGHVWING
jgi:hypothetical protein